jgi:hypothetical protein
MTVSHCCPAQHCEPVVIPIVIYIFIFMPLDPRFPGSSPAKDDGFLRVIKIRSTTSFGREVKAVGPMS